MTKTWKKGKHKYVARSFNGHTITFKDGEVSSKYW